MDEVTNNTNNQAYQNIDAYINPLLEKVRIIIGEIDVVNKESSAKMNEISAAVDESVAKIDLACSELDKAEQEASDEFDRIILEQAEDLSAE